MEDPDNIQPGQVGTAYVVPFMQQLKDYCQVGLHLVWQRVIIFLAALALAAYYYDAKFTLILLLLLTLSELYDFWFFRKVLNSTDNSETGARKFLPHLYLSAVLSTSLIVAYSIGIAIIQGPATTHFMSSFFLFAAALFAAMNSHYVLSVLVIRLLLYGAAFLFIPIRDIVIMGAPLQSELWAQFFTSVFVLTFIVDSSRSSYKIYRSQLSQMERLRVEHEKTKLSYKAKSEFVSTMSHELRTPLTSIKGAVDLAKSGRLGVAPKKMSVALDVAQRNSTRLLALVDEVLVLQKMEAGRMSYSFERTDLVQALKDTIIDSNIYASEAGVTIRFTLPDNPVEVVGDKQRLQQVFTNILSNAVKFSPDGGEVCISLDLVASSVLVLFKDEGIGLAEADADKVFGRFTQIDSSDTRKIGGTGLGMYISRQIMTAHDGSILYKKNAGSGTTFILSMKLAA